MSYLLDTNVVSELRHGSQADRGVRSWFDEVSGEQLFLSSIVIGELHRGVELLLRRDARAGTRLRQWLDQIETRYRSRILPIDRAVAREWGRIDIPDPLPVADALIAATAICHDLTLVTRNVQDFVRCPVRLCNPFAAS